jgi:hypothetical protein
MGKESKGFCLFYDWVEVLSDLDPADAMEVIRAISAYKQTGADPVEACPKHVRAIVRMMYQQILRSEQVSEIRASAAKAMHEKKDAEVCRTDAEQKDADAEQKSTTETETKTEKIKESLSSERPKKTAPRFSPPTLSEVEEYCKSRNSSVDPKAFWEFFNEGNWKDSKGQPVKNWKQKVLTWERYDVPTRRAAVHQPKESSFDSDAFMIAALKRTYGEAGA